MIIRKRSSNQLAQYLFILFAIIALSGCAVRWVADYDATTYEEILKVGKKVDKFYGDLLETKSDDRAYSKYSAQYVEIEADIQSLVTRNKARALNNESTQISESILKLWVKYKELHKAKNTYSDGMAKLDRARFIRLFTAAASAERVKDLKATDSNPVSDSE